MKPQTKTVLDLIGRPDGACMRSFIHHNILRYSARIHELRRFGYVVSEAPCERTDHRGHPAYYLDYTPEESALLAEFRHDDMLDAIAEQAKEWSL